MVRILKSCLTGPAEYTNIFLDQTPSFLLCLPIPLLNFFQKLLNQVIYV